MTYYVNVVPTAAHVEERLSRALERQTGVIAPTTVSMDEWLASLHARLLPDVRIASPLIERLTLASVVRTTLAVQGDVTREHGSTVEALARTVDMFRRHGLSPGDIRRAVDEISAEDPMARARLALVADVFEKTEATLAERGWVSRAAAEMQLASILPSNDAIACLPMFPSSGECTVRFVNVHDLDPVRVALFAAIARAVGSRGASVEIHVVSEPRRERMPVALDRALRTIEAWEHLPVELSFGLRDSDAPRAHEGLTALIEALCTGGRAADAPVRLAEADGPDEEARWVAAQVEQWLANGYAPDEIAIAVREGTEEELAPLARALDDARIPWTNECNGSLKDSPLAQAVLSLPRVVARGAPREEIVHVLSVLAGNPPPAGRAAPSRLAGILRPLRIECLLDPELDVRWAGAVRSAVSEAMVREVVRWRDDLRALADDAPLAVHASRLVEFVQRCGIPERIAMDSRALMTSASHDPGARTILRAVARDEIALRGVLTLLEELSLLGESITHGERSISTAAFGEILMDAAAVWSLPSVRTGVRGVRVAPARALVGRTVRALVVTGLNEGGFPAPGLDEGPLGENERRALLRTTGRVLSRTGGREEETLLFLSVMACATEALALSGRRHDIGGRALSSSPFMVDVRRATGLVPTWIGRDPLARSLRVPPRGTERAVRAWVQRTDEPPPALASMVASARRRAAIERERWEYFTHRRSEPGRYDGRLDHDPGAMEMLALRQFASRRRPVDVTTLERAAGCAFRVFAREILGLQGREEPSLTMDVKQRGQLLHALVEAGQRALRASRGREELERWAMVTEALNRVEAEFLEDNRHADRDLFRADSMAARRQVEMWLRHRMDAEDRWEMLAAEMTFGPNGPWPALEIPVPGEETIVIRGRIDGVERMDGTVRVVEFKSGRGDGYRQRLREGALDTQFQLLVYAAALRRAMDLGVIDGAESEPVDGVYVGFRDQSEHGLRETLGRARSHGGSGSGQNNESMDVDALLREGAKGQGELAEAIRRVILPMRRGLFGPQPRECTFCDFASLCRVERPLEIQRGRG